MSYYYYRYVRVGQFFSSFDMMSGFHQLMIGENSVPLTAFCTMSGLYDFLVMPMGTSGSPGHFQRVIQQVTADLAYFVTIYIDDVLVRSIDESSMVDFIERFLKPLTRHNLKISRALLGKITTVKYRGISRGNW